MWDIKLVEGVWEVTEFSRSVGQFCFRAEAEAAAHAKNTKAHTGRFGEESLAGDYIGDTVDWPGAFVQYSSSRG